MDYHEKISIIKDKTTNEPNPFSFLASKANEDGLYYHQDMQAEDSDLFKEVMGKEIKVLKDKNVFEMNYLLRSQLRSP